MAELNEQQIEMIAAYLKGKGIAQESLHEDLLDHVCTSIERLMDEGNSFEGAFEQTIKLFGPGGLKQVQQQTFEILTEMNETMKKVTFSFGLTSTILLLAGTIFKLMHWPGAGVMLLLGAALLVLVYLPLLLWHKLKESPGNESIMHISGFAGMALTALGALFKIMHWPGAGLFLISGIAILGFLYIPIYFFKRYKSSANKPVTLTTGLVALCCLVLVFAMTSVRTSSEFDRSMSLVHMDLTESNQRLQQNEQFYAALEGDFDAAALEDAVNQTYQYLEVLKTHLISQAEGLSMDEAARANVYELKMKYNYDIPTHIMWDSPADDMFNIARMIETLDSLERRIIATYPADMQSEIASIIPFKIHQNYQHRGVEVGWGKYHFYKVPLLSVVTQLSKLQNDVMHLETMTLLYLTSQLNAPTPPTGSGDTSG